MSPEQVRGRDADSRSDIFSFGAILYEMLCGARAFRGNSSVETMNAILKEDPPESGVTGKKIPPATDRVIRRCLEKEPAERFQSARDLAFALESLSTSSGVESIATAARTERKLAFLRDWRLWSVVAAGLALSLLAFQFSQRPAVVAEFVQLTNDSYGKNNINWPPPVFDTALATDGDRLFFTANLETGSTSAQVSVRGGEIAPIRLPLSYAGFQLLGISPDGGELLVEGYQAAEVEVPVWIAPVLRGSPRRLDDVLAHDAAWSPDKQLVAYATGDGLYLLDSSNTKRKIFTSKGVVLMPRWSPDGKRVRFTVEDASSLSSELWEVRADGSNPHVLLPGWKKPSIECCGEWTPDGRTYVFQTGSLAHSDIWAMREGWLGSSQPVQITSGPLSFSCPLPSRDGRSLYLIGTQKRNELERLELSSGLVSAVSWLPSLHSIDYSRDGKWIAYVSYPDGILWRSRADGSERLQLTYPPMMASSPRWSPDGTRIAFVSVHPGQPLQIQVVPAEGSSPETVLPEARNQGNPRWMPSGQTLIFGRLPFLESGKSMPVRLREVDLQTHKVSDVAGSEDMLAPVVSPDGKFMAALHTEARRVAIYDFSTSKWSILAGNSGHRPAWAQDSKVFFFVDIHGILNRCNPATRQLNQAGKFPPGVIVGGANLEGTSFLAIAPDGSPLLVRDQPSSQLYALKWQRP
jgi:Tol biopolymer transport system component